MSGGAQKCDDYSSCCENLVSSSSSCHGEFFFPCPPTVCEESIDGLDESDG